MLVDASLDGIYLADYLADGVVTKAKTIAAMENEAMRTVAQKAQALQVSSIRMIMESIRRSGEYVSDIAEIVLNLNVNQIISP
ncbi:MAG: hypothetical protein JTT11_00445 [Candidatus Brockarchaeota archaeon]|nr:hypothetical protein [Candidatus Brockarchaeota archaeon]